MNKNSEVMRLVKETVSHNVRELLRTGRRAPAYRSYLLAVVNPESKVQAALENSSAAPRKCIWTGLL